MKNMVYYRYWVIFTIQTVFCEHARLHNLLGEHARLYDFTVILQTNSTSNYKYPNDATTDTPDTLTTLDHGVEHLHVTNKFTNFTISIQWLSVPISNQYVTGQIIRRRQKLFPSDIILFYGSACLDKYLIPSLNVDNRQQLFCYSSLTLNYQEPLGLDRKCDLKTKVDSMKQLLVPLNPYTLLPLQHHMEISILCSVIKDLQWKSSVVFYENATGHFLSELTNRLYTEGYTLISFNLDDADDILHILSITASHDNMLQISKEFIIIGSNQFIQRVLDKADQFDEYNQWKTVIRQLSKWLIFNPIESIVSFNCASINLDNVAIIDLHEHNVERTSDISRVLKVLKADINGSLPEKRNTLNNYQFKRKIKENFLHPFYEAKRFLKAKIYTILYKQDGRLVSLVGEVFDHLEVVRQGDIFPNTNYGFNNRTLTVTTNTWYPYVMKTINNGIASYNGFCLDLLQELAISMNFSYTIVEPADGQWGVEENGSWTGLVGQLISREADLIVAPLVISSARLEVMDFSFPFFHDYSAVLYKLPDPNSSKWRKLLDPFKWEVIVLILLSFITLAIMLYIIEKVNPFYQLKAPYNLQEQLIYVYGAMLTHGGPNQPKSSSGRFLIASWWLFSIIVAATYSGNLIAFLTVNKDRPPFDNLAELSQQNVYKWGTIGGTIWKSFLETSNDVDTVALWNGILEFNKTDGDVLGIDLNQHLQKVEDGNYAFMADKSMFEIHMATKCDWVFLKEFFYPMQYGFGLPRNSPYNKLFYDEMLRIYETGLLQIWKQRWWPKKGTCKGSLITEAKGIELVDLQSAFYVTAIGIFLACICMTVECVYLRTRNPVI